MFPGRQNPRERRTDHDPPSLLWAPHDIMTKMNGGGSEPVAIKPAQVPGAPLIPAAPSSTRMRVEPRSIVVLFRTSTFVRIFRYSSFGTRFRSTHAKRFYHWSPPMSARSKVDVLPGLSGAKPQSPALNGVFLPGVDVVREGRQERFLEALLHCRVRLSTGEALH